MTDVTSKEGNGKKPRVRVDQFGDLIIPYSGTPDKPNTTPDQRNKDPAAREELPPKERKLLNGDLKSERDKRRMRLFAFIIFTCVSLAFFWLLWDMLRLILLHPEQVPAILGALNQQSTIVVGMVLLISATVPVSLIFALIKISGDTKSDPAINDFTPPQMRAMIGILESLKSLVGK
ncbi:hypothetical protein [Xanthomonas axonopodis]